MRSTTRGLALTRRLAAFVYAFSSGGLLALHAAARGLAIPKLALFEPPIEPAPAPAGETGFTAELAQLVASGRRREAVECFHRGIGVPDEVMDQMTPPVWAALEAVAPTLVYDCRLSDAMSAPVLRSVDGPEPWLSWTAWASTPTTPSPVRAARWPGPCPTAPTATWPAAGTASPARPWPRS